MEKESKKESSIYINPNKLYKIETKLAPGMVIEIEKGNRKEGAQLVLAKSSDASHQFFKFKQIEDNYIIETFQNTGNVIDVLHSKMVNENKIQMHSFNNTNAQKFKIINMGDGYISILSSINADYCLDVTHSGTNPGTKIWLYKRNNSSAQQFKLIGKNYLSQSIKYAEKFSLERNPEFETKEDNSTNFCSQCLVAGGVEQDTIWKKGEEAFYECEKFKQYFIGKKNIEWKENPKINEINPGDIIFPKDNVIMDKLAKTMFVMRTSINNVIFCSNDKDCLEENCELNFIKGVLKTSWLFK